MIYDNNNIGARLMLGTFICSKLESMGFQVADDIKADTIFFKKEYDMAMVIVNSSVKSIGRKIYTDEPVKFGVLYTAHQKQTVFFRSGHISSATSSVEAQGNTERMLELLDMKIRKVCKSANEPNVNHHYCKKCRTIFRNDGLKRKDKEKSRRLCLCRFME
jgi:hypothetical protein